MAPPAFSKVSEADEELAAHNDGFRNAKPRQSTSSNQDEIQSSTPQNIELGPSSLANSTLVKARNSHHDLTPTVTSMSLVNWIHTTLLY